MKSKSKVAYALFGCVAAAMGLFLAHMWYYQRHLGRPLNTQLGFTHGSPYVQCGEEWREVITIHSVEADGVFAHTGFTVGDIIVEPDGSSELYRTLHEGRGGEVMVSVVDGGDGPPLSERRVRRLRFRVPR